MEMFGFVSLHKPGKEMAIKLKKIRNVTECKHGCVMKKLALQLCSIRFSSTTQGFGQVSSAIILS